MKKSTNPNAPKVGANPFAGLDGEQFGGQSNYLQLKEGERLDGFVHVKIEKDVVLEKGNKPIDIPVATHPETDEDIRMPAAAIFRSNYEKANMKPGDVFSIARLTDAIKKSAPNRGKQMEVYALLVTKRKGK